jgi:alpha-glucosidase
VSAAAGEGDAPAWWKSGVLYQVYPRSFADSNGDGNGDIRGVIEHLDHLAWLGVDGVWLSPITSSPNADWGYDVTDFCAVQPDFGSMDDVDQLLAGGGRRGLRILMDLVPNHTSDQHPWFLDSRSSRTSRYRDWYLWADPKEDGSPPNNWVSSFGGPAWTLDEVTGQYFMHNHLAEQPDLNWWNEEVRQEFDAVLRFWFDRGVAGFRIDVCNGIVKDADLRDNPPATAEDDFEAQLFGQRSVYNANRPEVHDVIRRWRTIADTYDPPRLLVGETPVRLDQLGAYYGTDDELNMAFNFPFIDSPLETDRMRQIVTKTAERLPAGAWPVWTGSNHDMSRLATRWAKDDPRRARVALLLLLGLRGTPVLYQGDEIGLPNRPVPQEQLRDPLGVRYWPHYEGRDAMRTPMPWRNAPGGGFTLPGVTPWLPLDDPGSCNVEDQRDDPSSTLHLVRDLINLRRDTEDLRGGDYRPLETDGELWAWQRGSSHLVAVNLGDEPAVLNGVHGRVLVGTDRGRDGTELSGDLELAGWEGAVLSLGGR